MQTNAPVARPTASDVWMRGLFMLLFMIGFAIGNSLLNVLAVVQFLWLLFTRVPNQLLAQFGNSLSIWLAEVGRFLTCASDERPFPWQAWPDAASNPPTQ